MKATAIAHSNLALIKYWGKKPNQIPNNASLSLGLSNCYTDTTIKPNTLYLYRIKSADRRRDIDVPV